MDYGQANQLWVSLRVGTDVLPLLANLCSPECEAMIPQPSENYVRFAHKGSTQLKQPPDEDELFEQQNKEWEAEDAKARKDQTSEDTEKKQSGPIQFIKLIRKIWER